ncbi:unnamed protein product [Lasius platythorax]|uniref:Uncharacterized protein n=1 Tax=Lasius platythorax TaxID=488582 RepID=A0AAV2PAG2_9HYME
MIKRCSERQETRVLVSFATHLVCDEIAGIVVDLSSTVIDTVGLMAHYAAVYMFAFGKDDEIIRYARFIGQNFFDLTSIERVC